MKRLGIAAVCVVGLFAQLSGAMPMAPMKTATVEGTIGTISWHPDEFVKGRPGLSGGSGHDRTIPAHYKITLKDYNLSYSGDGFEPFANSGETIELKLNHPKDDGYLKQNMKVRIVGYRMGGDEGGVYTRFDGIEVLKPSQETGGGTNGSVVVRQLKLSRNGDSSLALKGGQSKVTVMEDAASVEKELPDKDYAKQLIAAVDFAKEKIVLVSWSTSGPPEGSLRHEVKGEGKKRQLVFYVQGPAGSQVRGMREAIHAELFAVPRNIGVAFDKVERI